MSDPTYEDAAKWLPIHVREAIEAAGPCVGGKQHHWSDRSVQLHRWGSVQAYLCIEHWQCDGCGLIRTTKPEESA